MEPFPIIEDFFSAIPLPRYRKYIISVLRAANSSSYWKKEDPGSLLYFQKKIEDLIDAAYFLDRKTNSQTAKKKKPVISPDVLNQGIIDPRLYTGSHFGHTQWETFPRNLSKKEFLDPYVVFDRFFRYKSLKQWRADFREIIFYALSPHSCSEDLVGFEFLEINLRLQKLIEAAHLIFIREIDREHDDK